MSSSEIRPKWWQLYLICLLLLPLFAVETRLKISTRGHQVVQIMIVLFVFGLIRLWVKANSSALSGMDRKQYHGRITVTRISPHQLDNETYPIFHIPDSGIKGVLSDTFEIDYIDAEFISPNDEVRKNLKKE